VRWAVQERQGWQHGTLTALQQQLDDCWMLIVLIVLSVVLLLLQSNMIAGVWNLLWL
jgi:hypothetical protein